VDERSDREREDDGADADASAEQPPCEEDRCFDCGSNVADWVAAGCESGHESVAWPGAETGADVHRGGDGVQHDGTEEEGPPNSDRFGVAEDGDCGFEHEPDGRGVQHCAEPWALVQWDPQHEDQQADDDNDGAEWQAKRRCQTLVQHVPRVQTEVGQDEHCQTHPEQDEPQAQLNEPSCSRCRHAEALNC